MHSALRTDGTLCTVSCTQHLAYSCVMEATDATNDLRRLVAITHVRVLCLVLVQTCGASVGRTSDMELAQRAKHWARAGLQFIICNESAEAGRALDESTRLLHETSDPDSIEVLEVEVRAAAAQKGQHCPI